MIVGLDSATPPTAAQAHAARAAGIQVWSGYLASQTTARQFGRSNNSFRLYNAWYQAEFDIARVCGGTPIAFASGWDDPAACRALAVAWNVRLCLDVENGIRADGPWIPAWLAASGAGLYGNRVVHLGRSAAFHILSWYVADPGATWTGPRPTGPCGWQWWNSHNEFGVTVDRSWLDPWFAGSTTGTAGAEVIAQEEFMTPSQKYAVIRTQFLIAEPDIGPDNALIGSWAAKIADDGNNVDEIVQNLWSQVPQFAAYRTRLTALLQAGLAKAGPTGPPGPTVDTSQFAKAIHEHTGTITVK